MTEALPPDFGRLLGGAIDVHVHGQPDLALALENRGSDLAVARLAVEYGMSGWVLKSHLWPTTDRAHLLREALADSGFSVFGSITLNPVLGGLGATMVELAAAHGARVVFLPTWGAAADADRNGYIAMLLRRLSPSFEDFVGARAVSLLDPDGGLGGAAREVVDACAALGLSLATGHVSLDESRAVAEYAAGAGLDRLLVTHPLHYVRDPVELRSFTELGALVELPGAPLVHPDAHLTVRDTYRAVEVLGPEHVVLSSDVFSRWVPPEPECLRMYAEQLAYLGAAPGDLHRMLAVNPRRFLGLEP